MTLSRCLRPAIALLAVLAAPALSAPPATAPAKGLFWKITSPTTEAYFFGAIHMASPKVYPLPPEVEAAFQHSSTLVVELDPDKVPPDQLMVQVIDKGVYPVGDSLDKHLSPKTADALRAWCEHAGVDVDMFFQYRPALAASFLEGAAIFHAGVSTELGIDRHFLQKARGRTDKRIVELETAGEQMDALLTFDETLADPLLKRMLAAQDPKAMASLFDAWSAGDAKRLDDMVTAGDDEPAIAKVTQRVVYDRNHTMAARLRKLLDGRERLFVVVGAAHLVGDKSVLAILGKDPSLRLERPDITHSTATSTRPR